MAAGAWTFVKHFKKQMGLGKIVLSGGAWRMALFTSAALLSAAYTHSTYNSVAGQVTSGNGYTVGGGTKGLLANTWLSGASAGQWRFNYTAARVWTAGAGGIPNVKFALIYTSGANSAAKKICCFSQLSTAPFSISNGNTLTVTASGTGVFNFA